MVEQVNEIPLLSSDITIRLDMDVVRGLQGVDVILGVLDSEALDEAVLMLDGTSLLACLVLGLFKLLGRGVLLQSDVVKRHVDLIVEERRSKVAEECGEKEKEQRVCLRDTKRRRRRRSRRKRVGGESKEVKEGQAVVEIRRSGGGGGEGRF